jgi:hypothetical protein
VAFRVEARRNPVFCFFCDFASVFCRLGSFSSTTGEAFFRRFKPGCQPCFVLGSAVLLRVGVLQFGVADFEFDNRMSTGRVPLSLDPDASLAGDARAEDNRWLDLEDVGEVDADRSVRLIIMEQADIVGVS